MKMIYLSPSTIVESFACPFLMQTADSTGQIHPSDPDQGGGGMFGPGSVPARKIYM